MYADDIAVMDNGKINQLGPTWDVYYRPKNTKLAGLLGAYSIIHPEDLNKQSKLKLKAKKVIRPNQLKLNKTGVADIEGNVSACFFNGKCYEVLVNTNNDNEILVYHSSEIKEGAAIKLCLI
jgi:ABC-type Fe3+/spermidine/putrescine transport system ATPase subunit